MKDLPVQSHHLAVQLAVEEYRAAFGSKAASMTPQQLEARALNAQKDSLEAYQRAAGRQPVVPQPALPPPRPVDKREAAPLPPPPPAPPACHEAPVERHFGGAVDMSQRHETRATRSRLRQLGRQYRLVKALGNGDCGFNALLGTLVHAMAWMDNAQLQQVERRLDAWHPAELDQFAQLLEHRPNFAQRVHTGHTALSNLVAVLQHKAPAERQSVVEQFCQGKGFKCAVRYLRARSAHEALAHREERAYQEMNHYAWQNTLVSNNHATVYELNNAARGLGVRLSTHNPRESTHPTVSPENFPGERPVAQLHILCWAAPPEGGAGHYDGLLPLVA